MCESYWDSLSKQTGSHIPQIPTLSVHQQRAIEPFENVSLCLLQPFGIVEKMQACHQGFSSHVDMGSLLRHHLHNTPFHVQIFQHLL